MEPYRSVMLWLMVNIALLTNYEGHCERNEDVNLDRCKRDCSRKHDEATSPSRIEKEYQATCREECLRKGFGNKRLGRQRRAANGDWAPAVLTIKECMQRMIRTGNDTTELGSAKNVSVEYSNGSAFISWAPASDVPSNKTWLGYIIIWFTREGKPPYLPFCQLYRKNQTRGEIRNGLGWNNSYNLRLNVILFPKQTNQVGFTTFPQPLVISPVTDKTAKPQPKDFKLYAVVGGVIGGVVFVTIFGVMIWHMKLHHTTAEAEMDVFITYSRKDEKFVLEKLLPLLDSHSINYTIDFVDFEPGLPWMDNLMDCICRSSKILIVMSSHYLASINCQKELQQALYNKGMTSLVLLRIDSVNVSEFPKAIRHRTFVDYADTVLERHTWKSRVVRALERNNNGDYSRSVSRESETTIL